VTFWSHIIGLLDIFKALADPSRRVILDALFENDGQTLADLSARLADMTRFGVMKHLRILEEAHLVVVRRVGRNKLHYLNPVPIQRVYERWVGKYRGRVAATLTELARDLEE
jgi:DNA-binding transcriptional ArsR family regulator